MNTTRVALLTGGSRGLGKDMALKIAQQGTDVILTYRSNKNEAEAVVAEIQVLGSRAAALPLDVAKIDSFEAFFERVSATLSGVFGTDRFDFLINNAGIGIASPIAEMTEAQFDELLNVLFKGVFFFTQKAAPFLRDGGRIVNVSSVLTRYVSDGYAAYASMKGAVEVLTRYLAAELGGRGITANVVAPGPTFGGGVMVDVPEARDYMAQLAALGRTAEPEDIGGVVAFLCSDAAKWVNGQRLEVTGGIGL